MALIPGPPTPTTWNDARLRRGRAVRSGAGHAAATRLDECDERAAAVQRASGVGVSGQCRRARRATTRKRSISATSRSTVRSCCSTSTAAPASESTLALSTWWFSAAPGHGTTMRRCADGGQLGDGAGAGAGDHQVGRGVQLRHPFLVADHAVQDAVRRRRERARRRRESGHRRRGTRPGRGGPPAARRHRLTTALTAAAPERTAHHADHESVVGQLERRAGVDASRPRDRVCTISSRTGAPVSSACGSANPRTRRRTRQPARAISFDTRPGRRSYDTTTYGTFSAPCRPGGGEAAVPADVHDHRRLQLAQQRLRGTHRGEQLRAGTRGCDG